jgi:hypothetical protein
MSVQQRKRKKQIMRDGGIVGKMGRVSFGQAFNSGGSACMHHLGLRPAKNSSSGSCLGMMPGSRQAVMNRNVTLSAGSRQLCRERQHGDLIFLFLDRAIYHLDADLSYAKTMMTACTTLLK